MQKALKKTRHSEQDVMMDMNMTPLIDVMLVLIIMLIISIPIQQHALVMNNPTKTEHPQLPPQSVNLDILEHGDLLWNGHALTMNELESNFRQVAIAQLQDNIQIHAAPKTNYNHVIKVLALAQREGVAKIGIYE